MKTTFKFIIAAMAAVAVFASCQKELGDNTSTAGQKDGARVISVQFDNSTKASLGSDGLTPKFADGDKIRVSNTTESKECTISVDGSGKAAFSTNLAGTLTAIYPAEAANYTPGTPDGPIVSPYFKVDASQNGNIAKAIIAKAVIPDGSSSGTFTSQIALFQITPPSGVKKFTITSLKKVVSGARIGDAVAINTEGYSDEEKLVITVNNNDLSIFYVALVPDVNLSDLSFEYTETDGVHGAMKGISTKAITAAEKTDLTAANTKYTINNNGWHPYVKIGGKKWATMNIGADALKAPGYYFAWGHTEGCVRNSSSDGWVLASDETKEKQFWTTYFENRTESTFEDAASANWGSTWRVPNISDFKTLLADYVWYPTTKVDFETTPGAGNNVYEAQIADDKGFAFINNKWQKWNATESKYEEDKGEPKKDYTNSVPLLFFPCAGYGLKDIFYQSGGNYWSSDNNNSSTAKKFIFESTLKS